MTVLLGSHAFDVEPGDRSELLAGADSEFVLAVQDPAVSVLDDDSDDLSGMAWAELDELAVTSSQAARMAVPPRALGRAAGTGSGPAGQAP
ncbi:hypothetical protein ACQB60_33350 [Actinomycetota bacterium Odt1-20B]